MNHIQILTEKFVEAIYPTKEANDEFLQQLKQKE